MTPAFARLFFAASLVLTVAVAPGCSSDADTVDADTGKAISDLDIGGDRTLDRGQTQQMTATVRYADGTTADVTRNADLTWNIGNTDVATIDANGVVTGVAIGATQIRANYQGRESASRALIVK